MTTASNQIFNESITTENSSEGFDYIALLRKIFKNRKTVIITTSIFTVFGFFIAISTPKEFTAYTIIVPQMNSANKASQLGGLAALAGIDFSMNQSSELSPIIYPKILGSTPFLLELMNSPVHFSDFNKPISIFDYYTKYKKRTIFSIIQTYTIGLPGLIIKSIMKKPQEIVFPESIKKMPIHLSRSQFDMMKALKTMITLGVEKKDGYLTLVVKMPEALIAAEIAQKALDILQREITRFKVEKSQADLDFIQGRYDVAKSEVEKYQINVAVNTDRFKNLTSTVPQVSTARLQSKFMIANNVFMDLAKQLEQAKIQVKKDTPIFTIVEPVSVPIERSKPNRPIILIKWIFLGLLFGISIIYGKDTYFNLRLKWKTNVN